MKPLPGFVDLQVNGYLGVDFSSPDLTEEAFVATCRALRKNGTAAFLPTIITAPARVYQRNFALMHRALRWPEVRAVVLGFHAEGPFISPEDGYRGAHDRDSVRAPDTAFLDEMQGWAGGEIRLLTVAAEVPGMAALIRHAVALGIRVSLGHQRANLEHLAQASAAGATGLTHLGNGLPRTLDRHPNPIWDGLASDGLTAMVITDGHHVPDSVLGSFFAIKGPGIFPVSDASPVAGMPPGRFHALGNPIQLHPNGRLENPDTGLLVGSSFTMLECMNHLAAMDRFSTDVLEELGIARPLAFLGMGGVAALRSSGRVVLENHRYVPD